MAPPWSVVPEALLGPLGLVDDTESSAWWRSRPELVRPEAGPGWRHQQESLHGSSAWLRALPRPRSDSCHRRRTPTSGPAPRSGGRRRSRRWRTATVVRHAADARGPPISWFATSISGDRRSVMSTCGTRSRSVLSSPSPRRTTCLQPRAMSSASCIAVVTPYWRTVCPRRSTSTSTRPSTPSQSSTGAEVEGTRPSAGDTPYEPSPPPARVHGGRADGGRHVVPASRGADDDVVRVAARVDLVALRSTHIGVDTRAEKGEDQRSLSAGVDGVVPGAGPQGQRGGEADHTDQVVTGAAVDEGDRAGQRAGHDDHVVARRAGDLAGAGLDRRGYAVARSGRMGGRGGQGKGGGDERRGNEQ